MKNLEKSGEPTKKKKTYSICLQNGHHQFIYKVFEHNYHIKPLPKKYDDARTMLADSLPILYGPLIFNRNLMILDKY